MRAAPKGKPIFNHRLHPCKRKPPPLGTCIWCLSVILTKDGLVNRRRKLCSPRCNTEYLLHTDPKVMRRHVFFRDEGRCAACNKQHFYMNNDWQADHIEPLFMAFGDPEYWAPENVQLLCTEPCHKLKSANDLRRYAFALEMTREASRPPMKRVRLADRLK